MVKLSVIIVNYNVKHFLEQCLHSVFKAIQNIDTEVFVVDNNSVDGSAQMIRNKFPEVKLIANKENVGFSKGNNQAIKKASGEYVLLLNPDTIVEEDSFSKIIAYTDSHPEVGGLGVKMIDGKGNFLPESKRGLPTPAVAFYKIFGLSRLFPRSKQFGQYHLSYLDKDEIHEVDVLSGAFMWMRKAALDKTGLLDENFFMYGEDIDMSYRIKQAGYKNIYFPGTTIIHYKGESTKKGSINYVRIFYQAMIIFANKHFTQKKARLYANLINTAIYFRAALAVLVRFFKRLFIPLIDALVIFAGFLLITPWWETYKFHNPDYYPYNFFVTLVPAYILVWLISIFLSGGYDKPTRIIKLIRGIIAGALLILVIYSLLPESYRFSRALIILGSAWTLIAIPVVRIAGTALNIPGFHIYSRRRKRVVIVGRENEIERVENLLNKSNINHKIMGNVSPDEDDTNEFFVGNINQLDEIINIHKVDEIIFCARDISSQDIISTMLSLSGTKAAFKIASPDGISVIGSNSINTAGDLYSLQLNTISTPENKRKKRIVDIAVSLIVIALLPVFMIITKSIWGIIRNTFLVLFGIKSWVGYSYTEQQDDYRIPVIKKGILTTASPYRKNNLDNAEKARLNLNYARDYQVQQDLIIIFRSLKRMVQ
ncbi:MAG: glycosyltransferase [Candidatus Delongbacteria bacterium]|jgi:GT2 family glycosyltransferase|nr:glycosyltransferase [Candidatus Delongbacteria bacterium]